jgi:hypothetical protein
VDPYLVRKVALNIRTSCAHNTKAHLDTIFRNRPSLLDDIREVEIWDWTLSHLDRQKRMGMADIPAHIHVFSLNNLETLTFRGHAILGKLAEHHRKTGATLPNLRSLRCEPWSDSAEINIFLSNLPKLSHFQITSFESELAVIAQTVQRLVKPVAGRITGLRLRAWGCETGDQSALQSIVAALPNLRRFRISVNLELLGIMDILPDDLEDICARSSSATLRAVLSALADPEKLLNLRVAPILRPSRDQRYRYMARITRKLVDRAVEGLQKKNGLVVSHAEEQEWYSLVNALKE